MWVRNNLYKNIYGFNFYLLKILTMLSLNYYLQWQHTVEIDEWESFKTCADDYDSGMAFRKLRCRYNHHNSPFLTIAPLKEEMLSLVPKISIFREAISDSEIELLKFKAHDKVELFVFLQLCVPLLFCNCTAFSFFLAP